MANYKVIKNVNIAVKFLYTTVVIGIINLILNYKYLSSLDTIFFFIFITVFILLVVLFFIYKISRGKNWARITFLIFFIIGTLPTIPIILQDFKRDFVIGGITIIQMILQVYALILLFSKPANIWFKGLKEKKDILKQ